MEHPIGRWETAWNKMGVSKCTWQRQKCTSLEKKSAARLLFAIERTDIVFLISYAWDKFFAQVRTTLKAVADQGWGPFNFKCLLHPELQIMAPGQDNPPGMYASTEMSVPPQQLNLIDGMAGTLINKVVEYKNQEQARTGEDMADQVN